MVKYLHYPDGSKNPKQKWKHPPFTKARTCNTIFHHLKIYPRFPLLRQIRFSTECIRLEWPCSSITVHSRDCSSTSIFIRFLWVFSIDVKKNAKDQGACQSHQGELHSVQHRLDLEHNKKKNTVLSSHVRDSSQWCYEVLFCPFLMCQKRTMQITPPTSRARIHNMIIFSEGFHSSCHVRVLFNIHFLSFIA